ncbi:MAG: FAD-binding oxidoreductase [Microscillaceae bacterium]|jgi:D-lactate dehydrogenase|nr:FAD-binding oxidoreductase [Microscillaceae bacterium]
MNLAKALAQKFPPERLKTRLIDRVAYASDAGFYRLIPQAVVQPIDLEEVKWLFQFTQTHQIPLVFRTAGTSLSGQSITDGILADVSRYWRKIQIEEQGARVRTQPGMIGGMVNLHLKKYGKKIGPDPASIGSCMMGGILSNNSSGMCCGVKHNSYHTLHSLKFMLPNGNVYDTENPADYERFELECKSIADKLLELRHNILNNPDLYGRIRYKYQMKNTIGYALNSLVDFDRPLDIMAHLLIGAEGTLGFIAEGVLHTIPDKPHKATAMLFFQDIHAACEAIQALRDSGAEALELFDRASLRAVENVPGIPEFYKILSENVAAILCEYQCETQTQLLDCQANIPQVMASLPLLKPAEFTTDAKAQEFLWKVRKGLIPSIGAVRQKGTSVVFEDIVFPVNRLADGVVDTQQLFVKYGYADGIIFGHAKDGNIHFCVTQGFDNQVDIDRYAQFMDELAELVIQKYDGALKAEHGTGRNMAPYVEAEWGGVAYEIMKAIKQVIDPHNLLNPGVILNENPQAHITDLKDLPTVEEEVDKCIECGFCEKNCPSKDLTLTPRRRILVRRELKRLEKAGKKADYQQLLKEYQYDGLETCAVDGLCATDCPVNINTGDLVKRLRRENHSSFQQGMALRLAKNFKLVENTVKLPIRAGRGLNQILGKSAMSNLTATFKKIVPDFPLWSNQITKPPLMVVNEPPLAEVVYFPTCISRVMGNSVDDKLSIAETFLRICLKTNILVRIPYNQGYCCGQAFSSKGFQTAYEFTVNQTIEKLWEWSEKGKLPIVLDGSSCTYTLKTCQAALSPQNQQKYAQMQLLDSVDFLADWVLPKLKVQKPKSEVVLHPVCSLTKMNNREKLLKIAQTCAEKVDVPLQAGCCGMAGDRGFLVPELTASATAAESAEVKQKDYAGYYASAKTCEMAMSEAVGKNYESILYLVDEVSE